jgi:hypothetical protein
MNYAQGLGSEFSGFAAYVRDLLGRMVGKWMDEFDEALESARVPLTKWEQLGGDPRFAVMWLPNARWRKLVRPTPLRERDQMLKRIDGLQASGTWQDMLRGQMGPDWSATLGKARQLVLARAGIDEGLFDGVGTYLKERGAHNRTRRASEAVWLLDQHLKTATGKRRSELTLLADLLNAFDLPVGMEVGPRWVEKRLELMEKKAFRPSLLASVLTYHEAHRCAMLFQGKSVAEDVCGTACAAIREILDESERQQR